MKTKLSAANLALLAVWFLASGALSAPNCSTQTCMVVALNNNGQNQNQNCWGSSSSSAYAYSAAYADKGYGQTQGAGDPDAPRMGFKWSCTCTVDCTTGGQSLYPCSGTTSAWMTLYNNVQFNTVCKVTSK